MDLSNDILKMGVLTNNSLREISFNWQCCTLKDI